MPRLSGTELNRPAATGAEIYVGKALELSDGQKMLKYLRLAQGHVSDRTLDEAVIDQPTECEPIIASQPSAESEEIQLRRWRVKRDRESKLYQTAIHEAGHALLCLLNGVGIVHAVANQNLTGEVQMKWTPSREADREISIAGEAAVEVFGFVPTGLDGDHSTLLATGIRPYTTATNLYSMRT